MTTLSFNIVGNAKSAVKALDKTGDKAEETKTRIKDAFKGAALAASAFAVGAFASAVGQHTNAKTLQAKLGLGPKQAAQLSKTAGKIYADNWGESLGEVSDAMITVRKGLGGLGKNADLKALTTQALAFQQTFGVDTQDSIRAVSQMIKTGLAKNAQDAFDILTTGEQTGADKAGDLFDTFNEYGTQFRKLGLDGGTALGLINQGLRNGARDSDLVADAIKEFSIRAVDGSKTTIQGFQSIGLNAQAMSEQIGKGGQSAAAGLQTTLDALRKIKDPVKRSQAAVNLFGTQAEDLGAALYSLDPATAKAGKGMDKLPGSAKRMQKAIHQTANPIDSLKRSIMGTVTALASHLVPIIGPLTKLLSKLGPAIIIIGGALVACSVAAKGAAIAQGIYAVVSGEAAAKTGLQTAALVAQKIAMAAVTVATRIWTAVQAAFNAVMAANPIVLVVLAIAALVAGIIIAYKKVGWFRDLCQAAFNVIKNAVKAVVDWITKHWPLIMAILTGGISAAVSFIVKHWHKITHAFSALWGWVKKNWPLIMAILTGGISAAVTFIKDHWNQIVDFIKGLPGRIGHLAVGMWDGIKNSFRSAINWIIDGWNGLQFKIPGFGIGPLHFGGFTLGLPDIPRLARGGVAIGQQIAQIGDNPSHREAIVPLERAGEFGFGSGPTIQIVVQGSLIHERELGRVLVSALEDAGHSGVQIHIADAVV